MAIRPHPQAYEEAFLFGESVVLLFYHAEHRWFHPPDLDSQFPEALAVCADQVHDLIDRLQRVIPSRSRPRLCGGFKEGLDATIEQFRSAWGSTEHREAIAAFNFGDTESVTDCYTALLGQAPVTGASWIALKDAVDRFIDNLPPVLKKLARFGELVSTGLWWCRAYRTSQQRQRGSYQRCLSVDLNGALQTKVRELSRRFPPVEGLTCDLYGLRSVDAIQKLDQFRSEVLHAIQRHGAELEQPRSNPQRISRPPRLSRAPALAWQSYHQAVREMEQATFEGPVTDQGVWDWISDRGCEDYAVIPNFENWCRQLRKARSFYEQHPDQRPDTETLRSIQRMADADMPRRKQ